MNTNNTIIRKMSQKDINGLNNLPPKEWNIDYESLLRNHINEEFFHAFVLIAENKIIGTGNALIKNKTGWLAHIMVEESFRGQGFGKKITQFLVDFIRGQGCETQLLIATELGEQMYTKLGFEKLTTYMGYETTEPYKYTYPVEIREIGKSDLDEVIQLDEKVNGENRAHLTDKYFKKGYGYFDTKNNLLGFYIPNFGRGLVISLDETAGVELLKLKHSQQGQRTLLPVNNKTAIRYFEKNGFKKLYSCSKMVLGKTNTWQPEGIYSYGSGYCG